MKITLNVVFHLTFFFLSFLQQLWSIEWLSHSSSGILFASWWQSTSQTWIEKQHRDDNQRQNQRDNHGWRDSIRSLLSFSPFLTPPVCILLLIFVISFTSRLWLAFDCMLLIPFHTPIVVLQRKTEYKQEVNSLSKCQAEKTFIELSFRFSGLRFFERVICWEVLSMSGM